MGIGHWFFLEVPNAQCPMPKTQATDIVLYHCAARPDHDPRAPAFSLVGCMTRSGLFKRANSTLRVMVHLSSRHGHWALGIVCIWRCPMPNAQCRTRKQPEREVELCDSLVGHTHTRTHVHARGTLSTPVVCCRTPVTWKLESVSSPTTQRANGLFGIFSRRCAAKQQGRVLLIQ